jgi:hypothetical protein
VSAAASASSGASPGRSVTKAKPRLFSNAFGHALARLSSRPGRRIAFSADSTPACATEDLPTPDAPIRIGHRPGCSASEASTAVVSASRPKK